MKHRTRLLIPTMVLGLLSPVGPSAAEEVTPTFQNATQAQRAANMARASITEEDMEEVRQQAATEAENQVKQVSSDYADGVVEQISNDYADKAVDEAARTHADETVEAQAREYALGFGEEGSRAYEKAYADAMTRATDPSFRNLWDTTYEAELERLTNAKDPAYDDSVWQEAYSYAKARATGKGYHNAWQTAYEYAWKRATDPDYSNAYQAEYKKALEAGVADITGDKIEEIHRLRYVDKLGVGVINKKFGLHPSHAGMGNKWKHNAPPSLDDEIIPSGPPELDEMPLEEEIAEATRRNTRTGFNYELESETVGNKNKGSKKTYGLAQTSGLAGEDALGKNKGKGGNGNGKSKSSGDESGITATTDSSSAAASGSSMSNSGNNSNRGGNNSNSNRGGNNNNSNRGGNSNGNSNSNKGGNGKNK